MVFLYGIPISVRSPPQKVPQSKAFFRTVVGKVRNDNEVTGGGFEQCRRKKGSISMSGDPRKGGQVMVRWTRSGRVARGKEQQAMQWAKQMVEWVNIKYGSQLSVYVDCFGEYGTIRWFRDYESLADLEKRMERLMGDQEYWQHVGRSTELFIEGSFTDTVMASL
jgi:hypothetical protein